MISTFCQMFSFIGKISDGFLRYCIHWDIKTVLVEFVFGKLFQSKSQEM